MLLFFKHATNILILVVECLHIRAVILKQFNIKINVQKVSGVGESFYNYRRLSCKAQKTSVKLLMYV